jgi:hypothetical protein
MQPDLIDKPSRPDRKIVAVDDSHANLGGASKTLHAYLEDFTNVELVSTADFSMENVSDCDKDTVFVIGNCLGLTNESLTALEFAAYTKKLVKFEFDYGFCIYRCEQAYKKFTGRTCWEPFGPNGNELVEHANRTLSHFCERQLFMSEAQMAKFKNFMPIPNGEVISSNFRRKDFVLMEELRQKRYGGADILDKYAIVDGNGGWHSEAKGVYKAIERCTVDKLDYDLIGPCPHEKLLKTLAHYKGLVFTPIIDDTCPRLVIEAALLGVELLINDNCQHVDEPWFADLDVDKIKSHLFERRSRFNRLISEIV